MLKHSINDKRLWNFLRKSYDKVTLQITVNIPYLSKFSSAAYRTVPYRNVSSIV
jgi:hypothetical protein